MWVLRAHLASTKHRQLGRDPGPCLGLFGPCRCKQHPGLIESTVWLLDHVATVIGLRAVRLREPVKVFGIGHCWPDRKDRPRLPSGGGRTAGAFFGAPKSAVERRRYRQRDRRRFVPLSALCRARGAGGWWCRPFQTGSQKIIIWCVGCGASRSSSMCCAGRGDCRTRKPPRASPAGANSDATAKAISRRRLPK